MKKKNVYAYILMIHGDADEIVPPNFLLEAKDFFIRNSVNVETQLIKNCGHHIPVEASSIGLNYILEKFNNCCMTDKSTILNGKLYRCPFSANGTNLTLIPEEESDVVDLYDESIPLEFLKTKIKRNWIWRKS